MIKDRVIAIMAKVFEVAPGQITKESSIGDFPAWDSLGNLRMLQEIQDEFNIEFEPEEIIELEDVNDIIKIVEEKQG